MSPSRGCAWTMAPTIDVPRAAGGGEMRGQTINLGILNRDTNCNFILVLMRV